MWIRRPAILHAATGFFVASLVFATAFTPARAETDALQACATQYQAAKADNKLNGQAWQDFFTDCKARLGPVAGKTDTPEAMAPKTEAPTAPKAEAVRADAPRSEAGPARPTKGDASATESHEKKCRSEWKAKSVELKKNDPKLTWAKYWKQCGARLSGGGE